MTLEELKSGLQNALERGESLQSAAQSFVNAGYNKKDVDVAARHLSQNNQQTSQPPKQINSSPQNLPNLSQQTSTKPLGKTPPKKQAGKLFLIILIIIAVLIVIGAGLLGLFWDKIF